MSPSMPIRSVPGRKVQPKPAKWRVECPKPHTGNLIVDLDCQFLVRSPRGAIEMRAKTHAIALQIARQMAGIDAMLARIAQLESKPPFPVIGKNHTTPHTIGSQW